MRIRKIICHFASIVSLCTPFAANATLNISTPASGTFIHSSLYGEDIIGGTSVIGQTFKTDSGSSSWLSNIWFWDVAQKDKSHPGVTSVQAYLYQWENVGNYGHLVGSSLYTSSIVNILNTTTEKLLFDTSNIELKSDTAYIAFLTTLGSSDGVQDLAKIFITDTTDKDGNPINGIPSGSAFYLPWNSADNLSDLVSSKLWVNFVPIRQNATDLDLAFGATFTSAPDNAIPEPATLTLLLGGLGLLVLGRRKRR